jgi:hypothetical protein
MGWILLHIAKRERGFGGCCGFSRIFNFLSAFVRRIRVHPFYFLTDEQSWFLTQKPRANALGLNTISGSYPEKLHGFLQVVCHPLCS